MREAGEENLGEALAYQLRIYKRYKELSNWLDDRQTSPAHLFAGGSFLRRSKAVSIYPILPWMIYLAAAVDIFSDEAEKQALGTIISAPRITIREKIALIAEHLGKKRNPLVQPHAGR